MTLSELGVAIREVDQLLKETEGDPDAEVNAGRDWLETRREELTMELDKQLGRASDLNKWKKVRPTSRAAVIRFGETRRV